MVTETASAALQGLKKQLTSYEDGALDFASKSAVVSFTISATERLLLGRQGAQLCRQGGCRLVQ